MHSPFSTSTSTSTSTAGREGSCFGWPLSLGWIGGFCRRLGRLAFLSSGKKVDIVEVPGAQGREIVPKGVEPFVQGVFTADGKGMIFLAATPQERTLVRVDLDGRTVVLHGSEGGMGRMYPSRDGRLLAFSTISAITDLWLLENL